MNPVLADLLETGTVRTRDGQALPLHSHLPALEGAVLQAWVRARAPRRVLEIGLAYGISSLFLLDALPADGTVTYHIIDAHQRTQWQDIGRLNLERAGYGRRYALHEELSELCLPRLLAAGWRWDFAFVDGWHTFDQTLVEFYYLNRMLEVGGAIVFDDYQLPAIRKLAAMIATYDCYAALAYPAALARQPASRARQMLGVPPFRIVGFEKVAPDARPWRWFREF